MTEPTRSHSLPFPRPLFWLAALGSVVMIGIGARGLVDQPGSAESYGVPMTVASATAAWIITAGIRDLTLGLLGLVFTLLKDQRALAVTALVSTIVPIVDGTVVVLHAPRALPYVALHWGSAVGCLIFGALLWKRSHARSSAN